MQKSALILDSKNVGTFFYTTHMNTQRGEGSVVRRAISRYTEKEENLAIKIQGNRKEGKGGYERNRLHHSSSVSQPKQTQYVVLYMAAESKSVLTEGGEKTWALSLLPRETEFPLFFSSWTFISSPWLVAYPEKEEVKEGAATTQFDW